MARSDKLIAKLLKFPVTMPFDEVKRVLEAQGYNHIRTGGSHNIFRNNKGMVVNVPTVNGREVKRVYLRVIAQTLGLED